MATTVVGFFDRMLLAEDAIDSLQKAGFDRNVISLVASDNEGRFKKTEERSTATGAGSGAAIGGIAGLVVGAAALAIPGIGPVVSAGTISALLGTTAIGAAGGGLLGALIKTEIPENDAHYYAEGVRRGGAVVIVKSDGYDAELAQQILNRAGAIDIREQGAEWRKQGWQSPAELQELEHSSDPSVAQIALSGARVYEDGLEMNPRRSRFRDFK
jgi:hypothetical protein